MEAKVHLDEVLESGVLLICKQDVMHEAKCAALQHQQACWLHSMEAKTHLDEVLERSVVLICEQEKPNVPPCDINKLVVLFQRKQKLITNFTKAI